MRKTYVDEELRILEVVMSAKRNELWDLWREQTHLVTPFASLLVHCARDRGEIQMSRLIHFALVSIGLADKENRQSALYIRAFRPLAQFASVELIKYNQPFDVCISMPLIDRCRVFLREERIAKKHNGLPSEAEIEDLKSCFYQALAIEFRECDAPKVRLVFAQLTAVNQPLTQRALADAISKEDADYDLNELLTQISEALRQLGPMTTRTKNDRSLLEYVLNERGRHFAQMLGSKNYL
jgi:hypothetical protein